ncbi:hypothetical protein [Asticcacaulis sp.]|uniref:hypothetical protein n=1 Tax=Asticcacaulis sp. TaxID=1872648 RepID=UPI002B5958FF|nr:hypothetical protein [Asticcacaulis sp.]HTM80876.1 hypothetical protein [Asticcacaulis sp.]
MTDLFNFMGSIPLPVKNKTSHHRQALFRAQFPIAQNGPFIPFVRVNVLHNDFLLSRLLGASVSIFLQKLRTFCDDGHSRNGLRPKCHTPISRGISVQALPAKKKPGLIAQAGLHMFST